MPVTGDFGSGGLLNPGKIPAGDFPGNKKRKHKKKKKGTRGAKDKGGRGRSRGRRGC